MSRATTAGVGSNPSWLALRIWKHRWTAGDAVLWDNRCLLHRAMPWDMSDPRVMWHSRVAGDVATEGV
ncbi:TauD/TfdA family dioxygenase [Phenylobacterium sp.]|uniref:TauD/TfdA family dioxygenase n=1 Tax=Phenylobacterium sp. TaxID=1871053 RepID=UPI002DE942B7|nr:TauD/TfdA family dioxygenase [Phenylobacterium sp.]